MIWRRRLTPLQPSCLSKTTCLNEHLIVPPWNRSNAELSSVNHKKRSKDFESNIGRDIAVNPQSLQANWANNTVSVWCLDSYQSSRLEAKAEIKQLQHNHFKTFSLWIWCFNRVNTFLISAKARQFASCTGLCIWFSMRLNIHACPWSALKCLTTRLLNYARPCTIGIDSLCYLIWCKLTQIGSVCLWVIVNLKRKCLSSGHHGNMTHVHIQHTYPNFTVRIRRRWRWAPCLQGAVLTNRLTSMRWELTFLPFLFQLTLGLGSPVAWHTKETTPPETPIWSMGTLVNRGGAMRGGGEGKTKKKVRMLHRSS